MTMQKPAQVLERIYHSSQSIVVTNGISRWETRTQFYLDLKGYFLVTCDLSCFITFLLSWFFADFLQAQRAFWLLSPWDIVHLPCISKTSPFPTRPSPLPRDPPFCYLFLCEPIDFSLAHLCDADFGSIHWSVVGSTVGKSLETTAALLPEYIPFTDCTEKQTTEIGFKRTCGVVLHGMII